MCASYSAFHVADFEVEFSLGGFAESLKSSTEMLMLGFKLDLGFTYVNLELTSVKAGDLNRRQQAFGRKG